MFSKLGIATQSLDALQPVNFSSGWPLTLNDWDAQMIFFLFAVRSFHPATHSQLLSPA
jgi:hypothetical protein